MEERIMLALTDVRDSFIAEAMSFLEYDQPKALNRSYRNKQKYGLY